MTKVLLALFVLHGLPMFGSQGDVSGTWRMSFKSDWTSVPDLVCTLIQKVDKLTGSCRAAGDPSGKAVELSGGKVENDKISCQWNIVTPDGETWTYVLTGTLDANRTLIKGGFKVSGRSTGVEGTFTATKQQS